MSTTRASSRAGAARGVEESPTGHPPTTKAAESQEHAAVRPAATRTQHTLIGRLIRRPMAIVFTAFLLAIAVACFVGPIFAHSPTRAEFEVLQAPSAAHPMGTDSLGRDLLAQMLVGGQVSLVVGAAVAALCLTIAIVVGGFAGYYGGIVDTALVKVAELFQVVPAIILALVAAALLGSNMVVIILILSFTMWPQVARIVRAETMKVAELGYVELARTVGFSSLRIFFSDVLPNAFPPVLVATTMTAGRAILLESGLAFLGLGDADTPSWGALLNTAQPHLQTAWWLTLFPGLAIFAVVLSINMLGDMVNDSLNPTLSRVK